MMIPTLEKNPEQVFVSFLEREALQGKKILLMVSGGVDSMVLLHTAVQIISADFLHIFHLNHNTRDDSDKDALLVETMAKKYGIGCTVEKLKTSPKQNKEQFWRQERQRLSLKCLEKENCVQVLTAHHATDLTETMIFNLTKGCGLAGLSPFDLSTKPFWNLPKTSLLEYAQKHSLVWQEDASNTDMHFSRNKIRHEVLPILKQITPNLEQVFVKERMLFADLEEYINKEVSLLAEQKSMKKDVFLALPRYLQISLLHQLAHNTSLDEISDALRWLEKGKQGGTQKKIGKRLFTLKNNILAWETETSESS